MPRVLSLLKVDLAINMLRSWGGWTYQWCVEPNEDKCNAVTFIEKPCPISTSPFRQCNLDFGEQIPFFMHYFPFANMSKYVKDAKYVKHFGYVQICLSNIFLVLGSFAERFDASALSAVIRNWSLRRARLCIHQKTHFLILEKIFFLADWLF